MKLTNLMAMSLDGEIAGQSNENSSLRFRSGLTNKDDQDLLHREIISSDAVIIGANTVRSEGGILELKNYAGKYPTWCVYTQKGLESTLPFWKQDRVPRILISQKKLGISNKEVEGLCYGNSLPGAFLLEELKRRGFSKILLLGGGDLNRVFYGEKLVDELKLTIAPLIISAGFARFVSKTLKEPVRFDLINSEAKDSYLFLHYKVLGPAKQVVDC